jgi:hypothetical protein
MVAGRTACCRRGRPISCSQLEFILATGHFTGTLYFHMAGVEVFFKRIKNKIEVVWPLETMDYGQKEFGNHDCDGYTLAFAEAVEGE